jgi:hypothetical protein
VGGVPSPVFGRYNRAWSRRIAFFIVSIVLRIAFSLLSIVVALAAFLSPLQYLTLQMASIFHCRSIVFYLACPGQFGCGRNSLPGNPAESTAPQGHRSDWVRSARARKRLNQNSRLKF